MATEWTPKRLATSGAMMLMFGIIFLVMELFDYFTFIFSIILYMIMIIAGTIMLVIAGVWWASQGSQY